MKWLGEILKAIGEELAPTPRPPLDQPNPNDWLTEEAIKEVGSNLVIDFSKLVVPLSKPPKVWTPSVISRSMEPMMSVAPDGSLIHKNILIAGNNRADHQLLIDHLQGGDIAVYKMSTDPLDGGIMHRVKTMKYDKDGRLFTFRGDNPYITEDDKWKVRDENITWIWVGMLP